MPDLTARETGTTLTSSEADVFTSLHHRLVARAAGARGLPRISRAAKYAVAHILYYLGILQLWQRMVLRRKAIVLMYHRVLTEEERHRTGSHEAMVITRETFARQMELLKRQFRPLSVEEFAEHLTQRTPFPDSSCLVTFDDGWRDNFTNAFPVLKEHGVPALVFLPVNYIGAGRLFWQESLTHQLRRVIARVRHASAEREIYEPVLSPFGLETVLAARDGVDGAVLDAVARQKTRSRSEIEALIARLCAMLGPSPGGQDHPDLFMDWEQVRTMAAHGVDFGGHGAEHYLLTQVPGDEVDREMRVSKQVLDRRLGKRVIAFSYPNGYHTPEIAARARQAGYQVGFIGRRGFVACEDDPLTIRRLNIHEAMTDTLPLFLARIVGLW